MPTRVIVRCSAGALYSTVWQPFVSFKALRFGSRRLQRCPVHHRFELTQRVDPATLTEDERAQALATQDSGLP